MRHCCFRFLCSADAKPKHCPVCTMVSLAYSCHVFGPVTLILLDASMKCTDRVKGEGKWQSNVKGTQTAHPNLHTNAFVNKVRMSPPDFNVNIPETLDKMTDSLLFWAFMVSCFIYMIWLSELHEAPYVRECC